MKSKKIALKISAVLLVIILAGGYWYMNPLLPIITGYAAKNLSSGIFVAKRTQESMEANDLNFSFIKYVKNKVNYETKTVKSSFLWHSSRTTFINGYGSVLINDYTVSDIQTRPYPVVPVFPENPDTIHWPMGDLIADTIPADINMQQINLTVDKAFADTIPHKGTFAVMVVYKGQPIIEKYKQGLNAENKFLSWSMAKSFTNALAGIMVKEGKIDIHAPADIEVWQNDERRNITINNLMQMSSGLEWNENYGNSSDVNNMLHKVGDMARFTFEKPLADTIGTKWVYSSGTTNIVSYLIRKTINNDAEYMAFPRTALFNKIGMRSAVFELDASGTFAGSSYLYATMRDYARFGLLYLNNGNWLGEQILPENWVEYTTTAASDSEGQYGAFFWLNKSQTDYPDVPSDMFCCRGHDGQYIYIIPSKNLVVVRTGFSKKGDFDYNEFLSDIVKAVKN
jgi:hypothetical protein